MSRQRDPDEPAIYFLPNLMTAGNLACGFFAVLVIFQGIMEAQIQLKSNPLLLSLAPRDYFEISSGYYRYAIFLIFGSCVFDLLDGRLARMGGKESPFGREFDSIADIVSFGMAPALLLSKAVLFDLSNATLGGAKLGWITWVIAFVYLLCGAMRLARFNCLAAMPNASSKSDEFRGIPIPMAAGFIASLTFLVIHFHQGDKELGFWKYVLAGVMLWLSWLMVSDVRYPSFKKLGFKTRGTMGAIIMVVAVVILTVKYYFLMPVILFSAYLLYGLIRPWLSQKWQENIDRDLSALEDEDDDAGNK